MRIDLNNVNVKSVSNHVNFLIKDDNKEFDLFIKSNDHNLKLSGEALCSLLLIPSLIINKNININLEVSEIFIKNINSVIQNIICYWSKNISNKTLFNSKKLTKITISGKSKKNENRAKKRVGCFFSGGVDSFYTLLENDNITDIIFVHGFDTKLDDYTLRKNISVNLKEIARMQKVNLIEVETNIRYFLDFYSKWEITHGSALAFISHCYSHLFDEIIISSSYSYDHKSLLPWGSHPLIDNYWSTENFRINHYGADIERFEKLEFISNFNVCLKFLRVCYLNYESAYNCGFCEKCLRTKLGLLTLDVLDKYESFENNFSFSKFLSLKIYKKHHLYFIQDNINAILNGKKKIFNLIILYIVLIKSNLEINRKKISKFLRGIK